MKRVNKDINYTLTALVPILQMNREKVVSIEAVEDWYTIDGREYMKEVAEIEYESGYCQYADIGCDSNLTAICDVIAVINQVKPKSSKIERIVRDVYPKPEQERWIPVTERLPEINCRVLLSSNRGNVFIGLRAESETIYQITDEDGREHWVYSPEDYDVDIEKLPTAEDCMFRYNEEYEEFMPCTLAVDYDPKKEGVNAWRPLPKPYQPDAHA